MWKKVMEKVLGPQVKDKLFQVEAKYPPMPTPTPAFFAELMKVRDGDTQEFRLIKHHDDMCIKPVRLLGVDTYETRGPEREKGLADRNFVLGWFDYALAQVEDNKTPFIVQTVATEKYGRWLGWVWRTCDGNCLNVDILKSGHGKPAPTSASQFLLRDVADAAKDLEDKSAAV